LPPIINVSDYYSDSAHSVADPERKRAYAQAVRPWHDAARDLEAMADLYRAGGDAEQARCVAAGLDRLAQSGALTGPMATNQAVYVQGWMLGAFAVAWLKVRNATAIPNAQRAHVETWLATVAAGNLNYYNNRSSRTTDSRNNHRYWAGFAVMAAGIAGNRRDLFDWGSESFRIGADQITPEGTLPLEMGRRSLALHYHLFAAAPMVAMAEMANANGIDLYGENNGGLARLAQRAIDGIQDPSFFAERAGVPQETIRPTADEISWAQPLARRYPNPAVNDLLRRLPSRSVLYLGGLPP
jgi:poly(beta-D-mannuronate) lyase